MPRAPSGSACHRTPKRSPHVVWFRGHPSIPCQKISLQGRRGCWVYANVEVKLSEKLEIFGIIEINEFIDNSDNLDNLDDGANNSLDATELARFADFE